jgi:hypothetical protein
MDEILRIVAHCTGISRQHSRRESFSFTGMPFARAVIYLATKSAFILKSIFRSVAAVLLNHFIPSILHMIKCPASVATEKWQ